VTSKKKSTNPAGVCFSCGCKLLRNYNNVIICKTCRDIVEDIRDVIHRVIYNSGIGEKYKDYAFKVQIRLVKKSINWRR
jgi:hypothetical protein